MLGFTLLTQPRFMVMRYRRTKIAGGTYFFTLVTHQRQPFLTQSGNIEQLRLAFRTVKARHPFDIDAIVILPDHLHCLLTLPAEDFDYSTRWRLIKGYFSRHCQIYTSQLVSPSRQQKGEKTIWQRQFWEHYIRNEEDFQHHFDYIHFNPVKHGLVETVKDWDYSSFHRCVAQGIYSQDWGINEKISFDGLSVGE